MDYWTELRSCNRKNLPVAHRGQIRTVQGDCCRQSQIAYNVTSQTVHNEEQSAVQENKKPTEGKSLCTVCISNQISEAIFKCLPQLCWPLGCRIFFRPVGWRFHWANTSTDVENCIRPCQRCLCFKAKPQKKKTSSHQCHTSYGPHSHRISDYWIWQVW